MTERANSWCSLNQGLSPLPTPTGRPGAEDPPTANPSSRCRATVAQECITAYNDLKLNKKYKFIIFKLSDDNKQIVVEDASDEGDWEVFREKLMNATTKSKTVSCPRI